ncbi:HK97 gp10 family phage protein [Guyparkeria sp. SB14A]|uniref:HK97 gp10 family phage protein n=1 Tax=Guyparkeria sp. SB14A TaxID=2571147 RepID=UPI00145CC3C0|nr:HK97 gp10 family phage protein [Guyparkeria sp. SB14A]
MTMRLNFEIRDRQVRRALKKAPKVVMRHASNGLRRGAQDITDQARKTAPVASHDLRDRTLMRFIDPLTVVIGSNVNYAQFVEHGRPPGGRAPDIRPENGSPSSLVQWIRDKRISPYDQSMSERQLAFVIARSIREKGIEPQPYLRPALDDNFDNLTRLIREGIAAGIKEVGL